MIEPEPKPVLRARHIDAIVKGTGEALAAAVDALLNEDHSAFRARFLQVLVGDRVVDEHTRDQIAASLNDDDDQNSELAIDETMAVVEWMKRAPLHERADQIVACARARNNATTAGSVAAQLQIENDPDLARAVAIGYFDKFNPSDGRIMAALNLALYWLHPDVAEPLVRQVLSELPPEKIRPGLTEIRNHFEDDEVSYRLQALVKSLCDES
jgi:hypothetical protein